jgi:hypothetical protein
MPDDIDIEAGLKVLDDPTIRRSDDPTIRRSDDLRAWHHLVHRLG